jgi:hypothetical protein
MTPFSLTVWSDGADEPPHAAAKASRAVTARAAMRVMVLLGRGVRATTPGERELPRSGFPAAAPPTCRNGAPASRTFANIPETPPWGRPGRSGRILRSPIAHGCARRGDDMTTTTSTRRALLMGFALASGAPALAQDQGQGGRHGPPPEAFQACSGQQEGAACTVTFPGGRQLAGVCRTGPQGEAAACVPDHPPGAHHGPPPEAVAACSGQQAGAACSFATPDGTQLQGSCRAALDGATAACAPSGPPPGR